MLNRVSPTVITGYYGDYPGMRSDTPSCTAIRQAQHNTRGEAAAAEGGVVNAEEPHRAEPSTAE